jgi:hypothetical protein
MSIGRIAGIAAVAMITAACSKGTSATGAEGGAAAASGGVKGLANASNDAAIVAAAKKALACPWKGDSISFDTDCADWKAWTATNDIYTSAGSDATLVNMIEDPDVKVRVLACVHLGEDSDRKWVNDAAMSSRVIAAAAAETQPHYEVDQLGRALARIQYAKTGNWPQAKAALDGTTLKTMERLALDWLLDFNETNADVWNWVVAKTKDADKSTAEGAVYGLAGLSTRRAEACKVWAGLLSDDRVGADAASDLCSEDECAASFDAAIDATEARAKAGTVSDVDWPNAMTNVAKNLKASDAQKKRGLAILAEIADNTHIEGWVRGSAVRDLYEANHAKGKALAAHFTHDKDSSLSSAAKDVLAKK